MEEETSIATETLAELYLKADNVEKAYRIYRHLLRQNPTALRFKERVRELELRLKESGGVSPGTGELPGPKRDIEHAIGELKEWLDRIRQARKECM